MLGSEVLINQYNAGLCLVDIRCIFRVRQERNSCVQIMNCIWSIGTDVSPSQVLTLLNEHFQRGWTLQTLSTYMLRMAGKGYLTYQRKGRVSVYHPLITKDAYFEQTAVDYSKIWGKGVLKRMAAALIKENELSKDDIQDLKDYLDEFDSMGH